MARPTKYKEEYADQALKLCRLGATDKDLADFFEVNEDTINEWKKVHAVFSESLKGGKQLADAEVANKLFHRATGYSHEAVKIVADAKTKEEHIVNYTEHYPPDTTAAIFWLKNRRPDIWRDRIDSTHNVRITRPAKEMSDDELNRIAGSEGTDSQALGASITPGLH